MTLQEDRAWIWTHADGGYYRGISPSVLRELLKAHEQPPTWRDRVGSFLVWVLRGCPHADSEVQP